MRAELARTPIQKRKRYGCGARLFAISTTFAPGSSVIFVSTLMTHEPGQIAKATTLDTIVTIGDVDPRRGQNRSPSPKFIEDERG
jgi:hypothetical protein